MIDPSLPSADMGAPNNPSQQSALMQLLAMIQAQSSMPNQATNSQGQAFQLGANGMPTPANPGSSPETSLWDAGAPNWVGANAKQYFSPIGPNQYGNNQYAYTGPGSNSGLSFPINTTSSMGGGAAPYGRSMGELPIIPDAVINQDLSNIQSDKFNQLVKALASDKNLFKPPTAPDTSQAATGKLEALPTAAPVNNQAAYTDPAAAQAPGMSSVGVITPPETAQQAQPNPVTVTQTAAQLQSGTSGTGTSGAGAMGGSPMFEPGHPLHVPVEVNPNAANLGADFRSYTPADAKTPANAATDYLNDPSMKGIDQSKQSGTNNALNPATASTTPGSKGMLNTASDPDPDPGLSGTGIQPGGGGMTPQMGSALASGIGQIGSAISKAYTPIKLDYIPPVQQPKSPVFGAPKMTADR